MKNSKLIFFLFFMYSFLHNVDAQAIKEKTLTVLYFDNNSGQHKYDVLGKGLADMFITDLTKYSGLQIVEREKLEELLKELKLQKTKFFDPEMTQKIGKGVGADYAITGTFYIFVNTIRIDIRVIEITTAKILAADSVQGSKNRFFDLQIELTESFIKGLSDQLSNEAKGNLRKEIRNNQIIKLESAIEFSQGIELADQGDYTSASRKMSKVMIQEPAFNLAKSRYIEILKQLYEAKKKRTDVLAKAEETLLQNIDNFLIKENFEKSPGKYFGYRIMRGNYFLSKIKMGSPFETKEIFLTLIQAYYDNMRLFIDEMKQATPNRNNFAAPYSLGYVSVDEGDKRLAEQSGMGINAWYYAFASPQYVAKDLAKFLILGETPFHGEIRFTSDPAPAKFKSEYAAKGLALLDESLFELKEYGDTFKERETIRALDLYAHCLMKLGRQPESIAKWQQILDTYPGNEDFHEYENKIKKVLQTISD